MFRDLLWKRGSKRVVEVGEMEMMEPSVIFDGLILASRFVSPGFVFLFTIASSYTREARNTRLYRHRRWNYRGTGINSADAQMCSHRGMHLKTY